jgi:hypothetical protein
MTFDIEADRIAEGIELSEIDLNARTGEPLRAHDTTLFTPAAIAAVFGSPKRTKRRTKTREERRSDARRRKYYARLEYVHGRQCKCPECVRWRVVA